MIKFLRSILANIATLLLSFVLALIIWVNAVQGEDPVRNQFMQVPVELIGRPDNSVLISPSSPAQSIQIGFQGPASVVDPLSASDFSATVDLSSVPFGQDTMVPILVQTRVSDLEILFQSSEQMTINLEQLVTQDIPVELDLRGGVALGYSQEEPLIDPQFITVIGTASQVEPLDTARVTVFLNNERETIQRTPQPIFYNKQGRVASSSSLELSTEQVAVTIPVNESAGFAQKTINAILLGLPAPSYRVVGVEVFPPTVLVNGRPTLLEDIEVIETEPINVTGLTESFSPQVVLALPNGVTLAEAEEFFVDVTIEPFRTTSIYDRVPQVQGIGEDLEFTLETETVRVVLFGPLPALNALLDEDISVTVDLFGLGVGIYNLEPDLNFPEQRGIELRSLQPAQVTVSITRTIIPTPTIGITGTIGITNTEGLTITVPLTETGQISLPEAVVAQERPFTHAGIAIPLGPTFTAWLPTGRARENIV